MALLAGAVAASAAAGVYALYRRATATPAAPSTVSDTAASAESGTSEATATAEAWYVSTARFVVRNARLARWWWRPLLVLIGGLDNSGKTVLCRMCCLTTSDPPSAPSRFGTEHRCEVNVPDPRGVARFGFVSAEVRELNEDGRARVDARLARALLQRADAVLWLVDVIDVARWSESAEELYLFASGARARDRASVNKLLAIAANKAEMLATDPEAWRALSDLFRTAMRTPDAAPLQRLAFERLYIGAVASPVASAAAADTAAAPAPTAAPPLARLSASLYGAGGDVLPVDLLRLIAAYLYDPSPVNPWPVADTAAASSSVAVDSARASTDPDAIKPAAPAPTAASTSPAPHGAEWFAQRYQRTLRSACALSNTIAPQLVASAAAAPPPVLPRSAAIPQPTRDGCVRPLPWTGPVTVMPLSLIPRHSQQFRGPLPPPQAARPPLSFVNVFEWLVSQVVAPHAPHPSSDW